MTYPPARPPASLEMAECYEQQLDVLAKRSSPAGLSVSTAAHAASVGEERFRKGDCRGASRLLRYVPTFAQDRNRCAARRGTALHSSLARSPRANELPSARTGRRSGEGRLGRV